MNRRERRRFVKKQAEISKRKSEELKAKAVDQILAVFNKMEEPYKTELYNRIRRSYEGEEG